MLRILGQHKTLCDGITRRDLMQVGGLSLFSGMTLPRILEAAEQSAPASNAPAKSVILFNLLGGPSHQDMVDMKPEAPVEIRGEFKPIATSLPGLEVCEHLPNTARWMDRCSLIRTVTHNYNAHNPLAMMTGYEKGPNGQLKPEPTDPPDIGAICQYLGMGPRDMPGAVCLPCYPGWGQHKIYPGIRRPGPYGGFLGSQYDPLFSVCDPKFDRKPKRKYYDPITPMGAPSLPTADGLPEMTANRFNRRRTLLEQIDDDFETVRTSGALDRMNVFQQRAFAMLTGSKTRDAFDLSKEKTSLRDTYGRNIQGSSLLVSRRLVEAGVPFISIHAEIFDINGHSYDMHENNFGMLKNVNLPMLDQAVPALLQDLEDRGLLDSTLVVVMGEMGRSPKVNAKGGRDHWPRCGFSLLAGGGTQKGTVYGRTDKQAGYPTADPVSPGDVVATIYHLLGIDPHMTVKDHIGLPVPIAHGGSAIRGVIA